MLSRAASSCAVALGPGRQRGTGPRQTIILISAVGMRMGMEVAENRRCESVGRELALSPWRRGVILGCLPDTPIHPDCLQPLGNTEPLLVRLEVSWKLPAYTRIQPVSIGSGHYRSTVSY